MQVFKLLKVEIKYNSLKKKIKFKENNGAILNKSRESLLKMKKRNLG